MARWHDGDKWTEHTLVIADQNPGVEPPPPVIPAAGASGAAAAGGFAAGDPEFHIPRHGGAAGRLGGLPLWAKVGAPIALVLLVILGIVVTSSGNDNSKDKTATVDTTSAGLDAALAAARSAGLADNISDARAKALIERICSAATHPSAVDQLGQDLGQLPAADTAEVRKNVAALGEGATTRCRSAISAQPTLIDRLQDQAAIAFSTTTTAPTIAGGTDTGTDAGAGAVTTDTSGTGTTVKGKTTTTVKGGAKTTTTKATTTTSTVPLPRALPNQPCSPSGAKGVNKITGAPMTCRKTCFGSKLVWAEGTCSTTPTAPPTTAGTTPPSTTPTTSGGTTGGTGGPTTGP